MTAPKQESDAGYFFAFGCTVGAWSAGWRCDSDAEAVERQRRYAELVAGGATA